MTSRRKWTRRILFVVLVIAVMYVAARLVGGAISSARLEAELERVRATGAPLTLQDAAPAPVPDALNAAVMLEQAFSLFADDSEEPFEYWTELQEDARALPEDAARLFQVWVEKSEPALARVEEAVQLPHCLFEHDIENGWGYEVDHVPGVQGASRALSARGYLQIRGGDVDAALATSVSLIRLGRCVRDYPSLIDLLVGMGIEDVGLLLSRQALSAGVPSRNAVRALLEIVAALPSEETLVPVLTFERALGIWSFERVADAGIEDDRDEFKSPILGFLFPTTARRMDQARFLSLMARSLELAPLSHVDAEEGWRVLDAAIRERPWYDRYTRAVLIVNPLAHRAWEVYRARVDLMRIGLCVELHELREGGLPETLEDLEIPGGTQDRCGDAPYVYRNEGDGGFLLYSVGPDGVDDGGRETDNPREDGDVVWRRTPREP